MLNSKKEDLPISISNSIDSDSLYCNICNFKLLRSGNDYVCGRCGITYNPEQQDVRHGTMVETLDGVLDTSSGQVFNESLVAYPVDPNERFRKKKDPVYHGGIGELSKRGSINIKSYVESNSKEDTQ